MLNKDLLIDDLCQQGFHLIDEWLPKPLFLALQQRATHLYEEGLFRSAKIGLTSNATKNTQIRSDQIMWIHEEENVPEIQEVSAAIKTLSQTINEHLFLNLQEFEAHFANYQPGSSYKIHVDQFHQQKTRQISFAYYLNKHWQEQDGGALKIYSKDTKSCLHTVLPLGNRLVCFRSDLPHEVCRTQKPRFSLTGWMKTRSEFF